MTHTDIFAERPIGFAAGFVALRGALPAVFVTAFRFGADLDFFASAFAGVRFFAGALNPKRMVHQSNHTLRLR